jgi:hypothetical protein
VPRLPTPATNRLAGIAILAGRLDNRERNATGLGSGIGTSATASGSRTSHWHILRDCENLFLGQAGARDAIFQTDHKVAAQTSSKTDAIADAIACSPLFSECREQGLARRMPQILLK